MSRFILRYRGKEESPPLDELRRYLLGLKNVEILDVNAPKMMLVDGPEESIREAASKFGAWMLVPEESYDLPDPTPRPIKDKVEDK